MGRYALIGRSMISGQARAGVLAAVLAAGLAGCASSSGQRIGETDYAPMPNTTNVIVFTNDNQVKQPFTVIGLVSYDDPGKYQILDISDAIEPLKQKARELGANAIILDKSEPTKSGLISTGIYAEARAIRLQ